MTEERIRVPAGAVICEEGTLGTEMYYLEHGRVEVSCTTSTDRVVLTTLGPGALFGELALLQSAPRTATVTAMEDSVIIRIDSAALLSRIANDPIFALQVMQRMAAIIRRLTERISAATGEDPAKAAATAEHYPGYL